MGIQTKEDRVEALELLRSGELSPEEEITLMDNIEAYDSQVESEAKRIEENKAWTSSIDLNPTEPTYQRTPDRGGVLGMSGQAITRQMRPPSQSNPDLQIKVENAAARGVDTTTGLRPQLRGSTGLLAFDKKAQWASVDAALREEYGNIQIPEGVPLVFNDESTGLPMYMRLTENGKLKPTLINPPGAEAGDFLEFAGEIPTIALETIGGVTGAVAGTATLGPGAGTVVGGTAGAGIAGALSIPLRVKLAEKFGAPKEVIEAIKTGDEAIFQGMMSGAGELLGFGLEGTVSGLRNFFGRPLDIDDLPAMEAEIARRMAVKRELQARRQQNTGQTPDDIDLSLGELTGDPDLLVAEANIMNQQAGKTAREMRARQIRADKSSRQALRDLATQEVRKPGDDGFRSVEDVSEDAQYVLGVEPKAEMEGIQLNAQNELNQAEQAARLDAKLDDTYKMRDNIHAYAENMAEAEGIAWANYRTSIRWDPETRTSGVMVDNRGNTPIRQVAERLAKDQDQALLASLSNAYRGTLENMGFMPQQVDEMVANTELAGLAQEMLDPFHLHMALSHMKRELRLLEAGDTSRGWEVNDLREVITAIEDTMKAGPMISRASGRPLADSTTAAVRSAWVDANATTAKLHNLLDTKNMKYLLETRVKIGPDGTSYEMPNMPAGLIRNRLLAPNDARFIIEAVEATGHDPRIKVALANELRKKHAEATLPGGRWNQAAHNKFMADYEDHMRYLGIDPDINNVAQFGRAFDEAKVGLEDLEKRLAQFYGKNVADPAKSVNVASEILSDRVSPKQAKNIMAELERYDPRLANDVREKLLERLDLDLTRSNHMLMNHGKLTDILTNKRATLGAVFGAQYVKDLDTLNEVLGFMGERAFQKSTKELLQTHFVAITRSLFGPLSKKQRFLTSVQRVARHTRAGSVSNLLSDPSALRQFVRLKDLSIRDPRYWIIVRGLGLTEYALDGDDKAQQAWEDFQNGTLQEEMIRRETPRRLGTIQ